MSTEELRDTVHPPLYVSDEQTRTLKGGRLDRVYTRVLSVHQALSSKGRIQCTLRPCYILKDKQLLRLELPNPHPDVLLLSLHSDGHPPDLDIEFEGQHELDS